MITRIKQAVLPIAYAEFESIDDLVSFKYYDIIFTEDFKDIKKDSTFESATINFFTGKFTLYSYESDIPSFTYKLKFI